MPKVKKVKKSEDTEEKGIKPEVKGEEEEETKEGGALSDGVLDAFEEVAPVDPLLEVEEEVAVTEDDEDDEIDSGDYRANDE